MDLNHVSAVMDKNQARRGKAKIARVEPGAKKPKPTPKKGK